jgi:hypothetical protein
MGRFWALYWGELALVEDREVNDAMERFGEALKKDNTTLEELQELSLALAHACRGSMANSWGVAQWRKPRT